MTRVALVGAGYFGAFHYDAWSRIEGCEIVAACDRDPARLGAVADRHGIPARYTDIAAMLEAERIDLIDITTPPDSHLPMIEAAVASVPWIICQKPFCGGTEGARRAVALAEAAGTRLLVHENIRFQAWYRAIKRLLEAGAVGRVYQVTFRLRPGDGQGPDAYLARQPYFQTMERFLVHETAVHWLDTFRYLLGEPRSVSAHLRRLNPAIAGEDAGLIHLTFDDGAEAVFDGNRLADHAAGNTRLTMGEMEIEGSDGAIRLDGHARLTRRPHGATHWTAVDYDWEDRNFGGDCVYLTSRALLAALKAGDNAETEAGDYLRNLELVDAVYQSDADGRRVPV